MAAIVTRSPFSLVCPAGTAVAPFVKHQEKDSSATGASTMMYFMSCVAMPQYANKSVEELRWEDYQVRPAFVLLSSR